MKIWTMKEAEKYVGQSIMWVDYHTNEPFTGVLEKVSGEHSLFVNGEWERLQRMVPIEVRMD